MIQFNSKVIEMQVKVGISMRHVHLKEETYKKLFGNKPIEKLRDLSQKGQFASKDVVTIQNKDRKIENVRVLGPFRKYDQVEISKTDAYTLKLEPPVRTSGDLKSSSRITIIGPNSSVTLEEGCIIANRHIHINPEEIKKYNLENIKKVKIKVDGEKKAILENVYLKIDESFNLELHLDSDDGNATLLKTGDTVEVIREEE